MSAIRLAQNAIVTVLAADATLAALSLTQDTTTVEVFNDIPTGQLYPHVLVSRASAVPWHTMGSSGTGWNCVIRTHVYSRYQGDKEALQIHERIVTLLDYQTLTIAGYNTVICHLDREQVMVEDIEKVETRHVVGEFRVRVHQ